MELLKKLTQAYGISGIENRVRDIIINEIKDLGEVTVSPMGNVTLHIKGNGKKLLFAAHMDEIGLMVTYIEDSGVLRVAAVGAVGASASLHQRVVFENGVTGIVSRGEKNEEKEIKLASMYVDIGAKSKQEAEKLVNIGDCCIFCGSFMQRGDYITSKAIDDRAGCWMLINAARRVKNNEFDLYFVFTVQEELGLRGGKTAAFGIEPDYAVAVDVTACSDGPDGYKMAVKTGDGVAMKIKDNHIISHPQVKRLITSAAEKENLPLQYEVLEFGGTDAGALQSSGGGIPSGVISLPCRYVHTVNETVSKTDLENGAKLIAAIANTK